jgi:uncharacterized membrane protein YqjE
MPEMVEGTPPDVSGLSTGELVSRIGEQLSTLVRDELTLARIEMVRKGKRAGIAAGLFGGGGALALYGVGTLIVTAVLALSLVWAAWLAALVVTAVLFVLAGVAALVGRAQMRKAVPPVPVEAAGDVAADAQTIKTAFKEGRQ